MAMKAEAWGNFEFPSEIDKFLLSVLYFRIRLEKNES
jgi:hypothetical protein